jgi:3-hydroxy-3-methylglutaryl CoA synthase
LNRGGEAPNHGRGIAAVGAYAPLLRLDRAAAGKALKFSGLASREQGRRAVASWDEDAVTMAIESARAIGPAPASVIFASTSGPFIERSHAGLLIDALALAPSTRGHDVSGSRRCAVSALLDSLLGANDTLIAAAERRPGQAGEVRHLAWGDGGAAFNAPSPPIKV